ncbi:MAG: hypothetical protein JXB40_02120, partial [Candidatus Omnitrophica bacterium]|nr:hypothetical protein [Candidatus Omnitrophota bacterium]
AKISMVKPVSPIGIEILEIRSSKVPKVLPFEVCRKIPLVRERGKNIAWVTRAIRLREVTGGRGQP